MRSTRFDAALPIRKGASRQRRLSLARFGQHAGRPRAVLALLVLTAVAAGFTFVLTAVNALGQVVLWENAHWTIGNAGAAAMAWGGWRSADGDDRTARGFFALGLLIVFAGQVVWNLLILAGTPSVPNPSDVLYLGGVAPIVIGFGVVLCRQLAARADRVTTVLNVAIVFAALTTVVFATFGGRAQSVGPPGAVVLLYPIAYLAASGALLLLALLVRGGWTRPDLVLCAALAGVGVAWVVWLDGALAGGVSPGAPTNYIFTVATIFVGYGAATWTGHDTRRDRERWRFLGTTLVPSAAIITAVVLALWSRNDEGFGLVDAGVAITVALGLLLHAHGSSALRLERSLALVRERALQEAQRVARLGHWTLHTVTGRMTWSDEERAILGVGPEVQAAQRAFDERVHPDDRDAAAAVLKSAVEGGAGSADLRVRTPGGTDRWIRHTVYRPSEFSQGSPVVLGTSQDITLQKAQEAEREQQALHDGLTGLPNWRLFGEQLEEALNDAATPIAVALLDLDDFKLVNDKFGHSVGDAVLCAVARALSSGVGSEHTLARLGGDEFGVIFRAVTERQAAALAQRLLGILSVPLLVERNEIRVGATVGVAMADAEKGPNTVVRDAGMAMYEGKATGKARIVVLDAAVRHELAEREVLKNDLRAAMAADRLAVYYQPQLDLKDGSIVAAEALVRWPHPERGLLAPSVFIPIAEEEGLIIELDYWVMRRACRDLRAWREGGAAIERVATNISARTLGATGFAQRVEAILDESGVDPSCLELEITESEAVSNTSVAVSALESLRAIGVRIAIDDFGTGYSMLGRLGALPFDTLKIDRGFLGDIRSDGDSSPLLVSMLSIGRALGVKIQAEGVETAQQLAFLVLHGCDEAQGYLFSQPVPHDALSALLREQQPFESLLSVVSTDSPAVVPPEIGLDELVRPLLAELSRLTGLESTYLTAIRVDEGTQEIVTARNIGGLEVPEGAIIPWRDAVCRRAIERGISHTDNVPLVFADSPAAASLHLQTYASVAVMSPEGELWGTLCGASTERIELDESAIHVMESFARLVSPHLPASVRR